jgi:HD-like signal output (HDOD) protein
MEVQSANKLQDTIHNIFAVCKRLDEQAPKSSAYKAVIALAVDAINIFNENEINQPSGRLTVTEY